ncbi:hypothetical protein CC78DRAFT_585573 [Lojkania enalia]|uniref:Uncharacterized protein n=1 Tax=Lojkania enalia TaxID=147567 RepID=A0A9P4JYZ4_9PLEO|nr:hypothetical protein CC78DRAFT_585573 [Didymosphaeria enalia]
MEPSLLSPPLSASTIGSRRNKFFAPLSNHGMPKAPAPLSPEGSIRSHRFESLSSPRSIRTRTTSITSPPMTPMSFQSALQSPPMSAKSFSTFIESEPSTPGFSPRISPENWNDSSILLLSPVSSAPSSPPEPEWEMMTPSRNRNRSMKDAPTMVSPMMSPAHGLRIPEIPISSPPVKTRVLESQTENILPTASESHPNADTEPKAEEEPPSSSAPLGKLATRMKSILRRKTTSEKNESRRRRAREEYYYVGEDSHWTEM